MTLSELGTLVGIGMAVGGVIANAAVAWWRIGHQEKALAALDARVGELEEWGETIDQAKVTAEYERRDLIRRVERLEGEAGG